MNLCIMLYEKINDILTGIKSLYINKSGGYSIIYIHHIVDMHENVTRREEYPLYSIEGLNKEHNLQIHRVSYKILLFLPVQIVSIVN